MTNSPSTRNLEALPSPAELRKLCQSLAALDAILCEEWESRRFSFNAHWGSDEQLGTMRDGCGDEWQAWFSPGGVLLFGLAHESAAYRSGDPYPQIIEGIPRSLAGALEEPAFDTENLSFCTWHLPGEGWSVGPVSELGDDGSESLLQLLDGNPRSYATYAEEYFEMKLPLESVERIYAHRPLSAELVESLGGTRDLGELREDLEEIGYLKSAR